MRLTLVGSGLAMPEDTAPTERYCLASAYLEAHVRASLPMVDVDRIGVVADLTDAEFPDSDVFRIAATEPDVVGFSCYAWDIDAMLDLASRVREHAPRAALVLGGPEVGMDSEVLLANAPSVDAIVVGEGEEALVDLLSRPRESWGAVPGVVARGTDGSIERGPRRVPPSLDQRSSALLSGTLLPPPGRLSFTFSRGCARGCAHCAWGRFARLRHVPPDVIRGEIGWAVGRGYPRAKIFDSALNSSDQHLETVARAICQADPAKQLTFAYFADHALYDHRQQSQLLLIPTSEILLGVESTDTEALRRLGRQPHDRARFADAVASLAEVCAPTLSVILGLPGDSPDGFRRTLDELAELALREKGLVSGILVNLLVAPRTSVFRRRQKQLGIRVRSAGLPYVLETARFSTRDLLNAVRDVADHAASSLFWVDPRVEPILMAELAGRQVATRGLAQSR